MAAAVEPPAPPPPAGFVAWLRRVRNSSRLALMLQLGTRVLTSLLALVWTKLLLRTMGNTLNGLFVSFQTAAQLGGVGDLGMGGAINIQTGQYLGKGDQEELQRFLASARAIFLTLALAVSAGFLVFMPWFATPLGYLHVPEGLRVSCVVTNSGAGSASGYWADGIYAGTNAAFDTNALLVGSIGQKHSVGAGGSYTWTSIVNFTNEPGRHYNLFVVVNDRSIRTPAYEKADVASTSDLEPVSVKTVGSAPGSGPLFPLFAAGAVAVGVLVLLSYVNNLNYGCGTITWPVVPIFLLLQCTLFAHWMLARHGFPLSVQYLPYVITAVLNLFLGWFYLHSSFPSLGRILPLVFKWRIAASLFEKSFWMYLSNLGNLVYIGTSSVVIQAWFGSGKVPLYRYNYKVCELAVFMILSASFVVVPKFTQWLADPSPGAREKVLTNLRRLNQFQTLAGCVGALGYLAINDFFMTHWLGADMRAPLLWQAAFALNLAVTTSGDAATQAASRCGSNGIRVTGIVIAMTSLVNIVLSITAARLGRMGGVALAAGVAQSLLSLGLGLYVCRYLRITWLPWALRTLLLPAAVVCIAAALRMYLPLDSMRHVLLLGGAYAALALFMALVLGINAQFIREEMSFVRSFLPRK
jgi:O-antigen/teichoic acid export membrane protein